MIIKKRKERKGKKRKEWNGIMEWEDERKDKDVQCEVALVLETVGFRQESRTQIG